MVRRLRPRFTYPRQAHRRGFDGKAMLVTRSRAACARFVTEMRRLGGAEGIRILCSFSGSLPGGETERTVNCADDVLAAFSEPRRKALLVVCSKLEASTQTFINQRTDSLRRCSSSARSWRRGLTSRGSARWSSTALCAARRRRVEGWTGREATHGHTTGAFERTTARDGEDEHGLGADTRARHKS